MMDIDAFARLVHENAVAHGWWEGDRQFPEVIALCHSELSEALEAYRDGEPLYRIDEETRKPEGIAVEMADCMIRILDWFGSVQFDPSKALVMKNYYNQNRPYRHGGKKA